MLHLIRTDATHQDFIVLVQALDADLAIRDGEDHTFYDQFNKVDALKHVIIAYLHEQPVACGALKAFDNSTMEVKRMYTIPSGRGQGLASKILMELEHWAKEMSYRRCVLETGKKQPEAIQLYQKKGYLIIPNYGQYKDIDNSLCFEKKL